MSTYDDDSAELHKLFTDVLVRATGLSEPLASAMMVAFTLEICRQLGQTKLWIPAKPLRDLRDECIREDLKRGVTVDKIVRRYDVSERTVYRVKHSD